MGKRAAVNADKHIQSLVSPKVRMWIYGVFLAGSPVAVYYGIVTDESMSLWLILIGAILGVSNGLALANVPGVSKIKETGDAG